MNVKRNFNNFGMNAIPICKLVKTSIEWSFTLRKIVPIKNLNEFYLVEDAFSVNYTEISGSRYFQW